MKISTLQENLKVGIFIVSHIAGKNANLPILNNILIKTEEGVINLIATDLEMGIITKIRGKIEVEGEYTVNAKVLLDYVSLLPNQKVSLKKNDNSLMIQTNNYKTLIKGQESDDYPLIPIIDKNIYFKAKLKEFKNALSQVIFSVSTSENRIELSGVLFTFKGDDLILASTDSFRLSEKKIKIDTNLKTEEDIKIIVPAKTLQEVVRIISTVKDGDVNNNKTEIIFYVSENQILFKIGETELISKLIEGQYPDYTQIIPKETKTKTVVSKKEFVRAIKAASIFSKTGINDVNLDLPKNKNQLIISSTSSVTGENITNLDATVEGEDNGLVVNFKFLLDGLNNINSENITLEIVDNKTPCILRSGDDDGFLYVIMPIKQ